jgi:hypothetical protein
VRGAHTGYTATEDDDFLRHNRSPGRRRDYTEHTE